MNFLVITHLGLGDMINMNGLVRYIASMSENVFVVCKNRNMVNVGVMYQDDQKIKLVSIHDDDSDIGTYLNVKAGDYIDGVRITNVVRTGCWEGHSDFSDIPDCFYYNMGLDNRIRNNFFRLPSNIEQMSPPTIPYIFTQVVSSTTSNNTIINWDLDKTLTIDPNKNLYHEEHPFYKLADIYVGKPFFSYVKLLEKAEEIHLLNSSFQCLAIYLNLKAKVKKCYDRDTGKEDAHFTKQLN
jgi:hypothetical protein